MSDAGVGDRATTAAGPGARVLHGAPVAAAIREAATQELRDVARRYGTVPGVAILLVGDDPPSRLYAERILRNAEVVGAPGRLIRLRTSTSAAEIRRQLETLNADASVGGIIVQMPLPAHIPVQDVAVALDPIKDIDGIHPINAGLTALGQPGFTPSCAEASVEILKRWGYRLAGMDAVVIGRSNVVGKPAHLLLMREHATVTVCHRQTRDLAAEVRRADLVVVAAGSPGLVTGDMVKPGAIVVDCGINVVGTTVVGDVDVATVSPVASAMTPVPGGVGPVTNAVLLQHLARAIRAQLGDTQPDRDGSRDRLRLAAAG